MKKLTLKQLNKKLDDTTSKRVRNSTDGKCQYCGQVKPLNASHFHTRHKQNTRWDLDNLVALCVSCHYYLDGNPYVHTEFVKKLLGSERFEQLNIRANTLSKMNYEDKIKLLEELKGIAGVESLKEG